MRPYDYLKERQYSWARRHGILIDEAGYVEEVNDNLFLPPTNEMLHELPRDREGNSHESVYAAHSSAALVVNVFSYWRLYQNLRPIITAICPGLDDYDAEGLTFEAQCPIGWPTPQPGRKPPHLDVVITYRDRAESSVLKAIGVESKFGELYGQGQGEFADCYLAPENETIWDGLDPLRQVAEQIHTQNVVFRRLHAAQLIKHILGLKSRFQGTKNFELIYLWYPAPGPEAVQHEEEIGLFIKMTRYCEPRVRFRPINYHDLITTLATFHGQEHGAYIDYLTERYF